MGESADQIAQELERKRAEASEKIGKIEEQVSNSADQVMETVDIRHQIEQRPLVALGVAFTGGVVLGGLVGGNGDSDRSQGTRGYDPMPRYSMSGNNQSSGLMSTLRQTAKNSGLEDSFNSAAAAMMASMGERLKASMESSYPGFRERFESATQTDGGVTDKAKAASSV